MESRQVTTKAVPVRNTSHGQFVQSEYGILQRGFLFEHVVAKAYNGKVDESKCAWNTGSDVNTDSAAISVKSQKATLASANSLPIMENSDKAKMQAIQMYRENVASNRFAFCIADNHKSNNPIEKVDIYMMNLDEFCEFLASECWRIEESSSHGGTREKKLVLRCRSYGVARKWLEEQLAKA